VVPVIIRKQINTLIKIGAKVLPSSQLQSEELWFS